MGGGSYGLCIHCDKSRYVNRLYLNIATRLLSDQSNSIIGNNFNLKKSILNEILISKKKLAGIFVGLTVVVLLILVALYFLFARHYLNKRKHNTT